MAFRPLGACLQEFETVCLTFSDRVAINDAPMFGVLLLSVCSSCQAPVGFWDPLGLSKDGDAKVFRRRRESEIKHGRIAMIAAMGFILPECFPIKSCWSEGALIGGHGRETSALKVCAVAWSHLHFKWSEP